MIEITIEKNDAGQRVDRFLKKYLHNAPLSAIYKLIRKDMKLNGRRTDHSTMLNEGDILTLYMDASELEELSAKRNFSRKAKETGDTVDSHSRSYKRRRLEIVYEDENILVADKPANLLVHGTEKEKKRTLTNLVVDYLIEQGSFVPRIEKTFTPSPAHRLDRNTSGLVIFGKNAPALRELSEAMSKPGAIEKWYMGIVFGELEEEMTLEGRLLKDEEHNMVRMVEDFPGEGKAATTTVIPLTCAKGFSLVKIRLLTGRTHQIRVHLSAAGYPLAGDPKYGSNKLNLKTFTKERQLLHAHKLIFHTSEGNLAYLAESNIMSKLPEDFLRAGRALLSEEIFDAAIECER